jgi:hypothetical protein
MKALVVCVLPLLVVTMPACEKKSPASAPAEEGAKAERAPSEASDELVTPPGKGSVVVLLEPGAEPRAPLRYKLTNGKRAAMDILMTMSMEITMNGQKQPTAAIPPMRIVMETTITEVMSENEASYFFRVTDAGVAETAGYDPAAVSLLNTQLATIIGAKGTAKVDSRGFNTDVTMDLPAGLDPQMRQMMESTRQSIEQMSSPLPEEAVGLGAKWELRQLIEQSGMKMKQRTRFTYVEGDGASGKLEAETKQIAENQKITTNGVTVDLESLKGSGKGIVNFDLAYLVPTKSLVELDTETVVSQAGAKVDMAMKMKVELNRK